VFEGEKLALTLLMKDREKERIASAYLFFGGLPFERRKISREFAQAINCEEKKFPPCGKCPSCEKTAKGLHPDVIFISPRGASRSIGINEIREIKRISSLPPLEGRWRVIVIEDAHRMTREAENSLLKLLEEPPPFHTFILLSPQPESLLPTIVSRCKKIRFSHPPSREIEENLRNLVNWEEDRLRVFSRITPGDESSIQLWEEGELWKKREEIFRNLTGKNFSLTYYLEELPSWIEKKKNQWKKEFQERVRESEEREVLSPPPTEEKTRSLLHQLMDIHLSFFLDIEKLRKGYQDIINEDFRKELESMRVIEENRLREIIGFLERTHLFLERNVNLSLLFGSLGLKLLVLRRRKGKWAK